MFFRKFLIFLIFINTHFLFSKNNDPGATPKKSYIATRIESAPKIDGVLKEEVWKNKPVATNFVMVEPGDGDPAPEDHRTEVKVLYDDEAIYIAGYMWDDEPEKIITQFTQRDNLEQAEFLLIDFNPYNDGENQTRFIVTSAGAMADGKANGSNEDYSFNTVWDAAVSMDEKGWYAEIRIPYSALRFPQKEEQLWGLQFAREITHRNETYTWNYVDKKVGKISQHAGLLKGIRNIDAPVRLSLYPYTSVEADNYQGHTDVNFNAGIDLKYGINDAFTLDATLIPDFGQTAFDKVELNLGPFEQTFGENRAFSRKAPNFSPKEIFFIPEGLETLPLALILPRKICWKTRRSSKIQKVQIF